MNLSHCLSRRGWWLVASLLALLLAGCRQEQPAATPTLPSDTAVQETLPAVEALALIEPEAGGAVRLRDGAEVSLPPQALSTESTVTLRVLDDPPSAPIPRSLLGHAYEFTVEDGELTGVALLRVPLPAAAASDQYELASYHWNGANWERLNSRRIGDVLQFGIGAPGIFALQGTWRLADATLALVKPETASGQTASSLTVNGQYRFSALPVLSGEYLQARLVLKQDVSGGAGRVTGNPELDTTVAEATLYFRPDPAQAQGLIDFSQVFEVPPSNLNIPPGGTTRLYASLTVEDGVAPTRRLSTGIEYTQILPIRIVEMSVVRPKLAAEGQYPLRWHVRLNGQTFSLLDAIDTRLALDDILARGGLGDYRFTLETETTGIWAPVSNEVTVQLALKPTETPLASPEPSSGTLVAITSPTPAMSGTVPGGSLPVTPTRRPTPIGGGPLPSATPTPAAGATSQPPAVVPTRPAWANVFWADHYVLNLGECTNLHWHVENVNQVFFNGAATEGSNTRQECPQQTTSYILRIISNAGTEEIVLPITVSTQAQTAIEFTADSYRIAPGQSTVLRWRVTGVKEVYLNDKGVGGEDSAIVSPTTETPYTLRVVSLNGTSTERTIRIMVSAAALVDARFWADQYTMRLGTCTTLHWIVRDVREVYLNGAGVEGTGTQQVCPDGDTFFTLSVVPNDGSGPYDFDVSIASGDPVLTSGEIIAQGIVNEITYQADLDSLTSGEQAGYKLVVDGINRLFAESGNWSQAAVTLRVPQEFVTPSEDEEGLLPPISWPINPGQWVEFRAKCAGATCVLELTPTAYLYLRSP